MPKLPVLITSDDLLPGTRSLNGRRWAGQALLKSWAKYSNDSAMGLAHSNPQELKKLLPLLRKSGLRGPLYGLNLVDPEAVKNWGGLFLPDPSIGKWSQWRRKVGAAAFSLIGQIHTLSTQAAINHMQELVSESIEPWDALICSTSAGQEVVLSIINDRENHLIDRCGGSKEELVSHRPQLPIIPLPLPLRNMIEIIPKKWEARASLGIPEQSIVFIWLGRLSIYTKLDPWPSYRLLQRIAKRIDQKIVLIECGPDDKPSHNLGLNKLRELCPDINFIRLGGEKPVSEDMKNRALVSSDICLSLVDNTQETFGISIAEAMAFGLPVVASDWNGYKDLISNDVDGFLIPTRWSYSSKKVSEILGWEHYIGIQSYQGVSGALAQLVQIDVTSAEETILKLINNPNLAKTIGNSARLKALDHFDEYKIMERYSELFLRLKEIRKMASMEKKEPVRTPIHLNPVEMFKHYPSDIRFNDDTILNDCSVTMESELTKEHNLLWKILSNRIPKDSKDMLFDDIAQKHK